MNLRYSMIKKRGDIVYKTDFYKPGCITLRREMDVDQDLLRYLLCAGHDQITYRLCNQRSILHDMPDNKKIR
jgi:hypothetical protein